MPELNKDGSLRQLESLGGVFRIISIAPTVTEGTSAPSTATPPLDAGKLFFPIYIDFDLILTTYYVTIHTRNRNWKINVLLNL